MSAEKHPFECDPHGYAGDDCPWCRVTDLEVALRKAAETFEDIEKASRLLLRLPMAEAARIAGAGCRETLEKYG